LSGCVMLTRIECSAFAKCTAMKSVRLPENLKEIGFGVFWDCKSLVDIGIPRSVTVIGGNCFHHCESMECIHIPAKVIAIHEFTFCGCHLLKSMTFAPEGECAVEYLGEAFISGCINLETFSLPPSVTNMSIDAFKGFFGGILLPWGNFEHGPGRSLGRHPVLTMASVLLQRAGKQSEIPIHGMNSDALTAANLVILLTVLMASPELTNSRGLHHVHFVGYDQEIVLTQAILLTVETFMVVLLGSGGDSLLDDHDVRPAVRCIREISTSTSIPSPTLVSRKRKSCA
jgi:BspA type Leucine rich repeat region (6 copies)